ncbi:phage tail protein [Alteromonas sp. a30]|uniref:phage tail protein n=1 Tax=Alteromonas sp. a30 TaxID=2730917 RepID=UPI0022801FFF|nr:hypothetical protein [Alteromonas sp. a30]MCY7294206.1 hypothetical protein [Alteromonas sp. a30]
MTAKNRRELKQKFRTGAQPTAQDYADVFDSGFNALDDGISKPLEPYLPVRIKGNGAGLNILDFYNDDNHHWRMSLLSDNDSGYTIADPSGNTHFFMEDGSGNIGLGMSKPKAKLHINQSDDAGDALYVEDFANDDTPTRITNAGNIYVRSQVESEIEGANFYVNGDTRIVNETSDQSFMHINRFGGISFNALTTSTSPQVDMHCPMYLHDALVVDSDVEIKGKLTVNQEIDIKSVAQANGGTIQLGDTNGDQVSIPGLLNSGDGDALQINDSVNVYEHLQVGATAQISTSLQLGASQTVNTISNDLGDGLDAGKLLTERAIHQIMPRGAIIMWSGTEVPNGWALCDGENGTPDLRSRFIIGAGQGSGLTERSLLQKSGSETKVISVANMPSHKHTLNEAAHNHGVNDPGHNHNINDPGHSHVYRGHRNNDGDDADDRTQATHDGDKDTSRATTGITLDSSSSNVSLDEAKTDITMDATGGGEALDIMPPFCALYFIMKLTG